MKNTSILLIALFSISKFVVAQTQLPAIIDSNITLTSSYSPYIVNQNSLVVENTTVIIEPGVIIKTDPNTSKDLLVQGELIAIGNKNNPILFEALSVKFDSKSNGYSSVTDSGSQFRYCKFSQGYSAKHSIYNDGNSLKFNNCSFKNSYYSIYSRGGSQENEIIIDSCEFNGQSEKGYPIYSSGTKSTISITNSNFSDCYGVYAYSDNFNIKNNKFDRLNSATFTFYGSGIISCNKFNNIKGGVILNIYTGYDTLDLNFSNNTLDTVGGGFYPMLKLYGTTPQNNYPQNIKINYNNFLNCDSNVKKIQITGTNKDPQNFTEVNAQNNFWLSTDSTKISNMISDYNSDIMIWAKLSWNNFSNSILNNCTDNTNSVFDLEYHLPKTLLKIYNLQGKQIENPLPNQIYIYHYNDGSRVKNVIIE